MTKPDIKFGFVLKILVVWEPVELSQPKNESGCPFSLSVFEILDSLDRCSIDPIFFNCTFNIHQCNINVFIHNPTRVVDINMSGGQCMGIEGHSRSILYKKIPTESESKSLLLRDQCLLSSISLLIWKCKQLFPNGFITKFL